MFSLKIVADSALQDVTEAFARFGDVVTLPGRAIDAAAVRDAEVLLVRSVTPVTAKLIASSRLRFVATATSGVDHLEIAALEAAGIQWAHAPGCNALAVAEYVAGCLAWLAQQTGQSLCGKSLGIMGLGQTGSRVAAMADALGMTVRWFDPFVPAARPDWQKLAKADELLACDVLSLHVPLISEGVYPTHHWLDASRLARLPAHSWLINACRGAVVDNHALLQHLQQHDRPVVLDVWENEPTPDLHLLEKVRIATPHIAGYSQAGKQRGLQMIYQAFCDWQGVPAEWQAPALPPAGVLAVDDVLAAVAQASCVQALDRHFRQAIKTQDLAAAFDACRRDAASRAEFSSWQLQCPDADVARKLASLGFSVETAC
ncbi:MAG: 4-phosphoerythronate dehydrogenase [Gammaproteobacteria bacterium]|nr:MAG: 4-phosphoerythronate dehydrogenase [Gammaproteobacteria bacterium]